MKDRRRNHHDRRKQVRHVKDIPDPVQHPWKYRYVTTRWKIALAVTTHPILVALTLAMVIASVPLYLFLGVSQENRDQQTQIAGLVKRIQDERKKTVGIFCRRINNNIDASKRLSNYLQQLIVVGAKQSRAFEDLYQAHGFPPYNVRLRLAKKQAKRITSFNNAPIKCRQIKREIQRTTPPPPGPVTAPK